MNFGIRNELHAYNAQRRAERVQNRLAWVFFAGFAVYIIWGAL